MESCGNRKITIIIEDGNGMETNEYHERYEQAMEMFDLWDETMEKWDAIMETLAIEKLAGNDEMYERVRKLMDARKVMETEMNELGWEFVETKNPWGDEA